MSTIKVTNVNPPTAGNAVNINGLAYPTAGPLSNRNVFHNGAMRVDQRNTASSAITFDAGGTTSGYSVDGCKFFNIGTGELDLQTEQVTEAPVGFSNSLRVTVATAESSGGTPDADDRATLQMRLEGNATTNFAFGTSDAKDFVLSFYVRASTAGNYGAVVTNSSDRSYPVLYNIASANTWERKTIKLPACTDGTWNTGTGTNLILKFSFYVGSNRLGTDQGVDGSGTWVTNQTAQGTTNQVQFGGTVNETWHITGVQLEVGSVATPFEHRSYGDELLRCQRYYWNLLLEKGQTNVYLGNGAQYDGTTSFMVLHPPVTMRTEPSADFSNATGHFAKLANNSATNFSTFAIDGSNSAACITVSYNASGSSGHANFVRAQNTDSKFAFSAEL